MSASVKDTNCKLLTVKQAADYIGVARQTLQAWLQRGLLPFIELPATRPRAVYRFIRLRREDLDDFLERHYRRSAIADKPAKSLSNQLIPRCGKEDIIVL